MDADPVLQCLIQKSSVEATQLYEKEQKLKKRSKSNKNKHLTTTKRYIT